MILGSETAVPTKEMTRLFYIVLKLGFSYEFQHALQIARDFTGVSNAI
jgi:hypothetical protein